MTTSRHPGHPGALTTQQAADVLGVCVDTVMRYLSEGCLTELRPPAGSRPRFFSRAEVEALAAERARRPLPRRQRGLDLTSLTDGRFLARYWSKVDFTRDCWTWTRHITEAGYGQFMVSKGNFRLAHVVSFALANSPVPAGMYVCHHCDNPPCVRPDHLFLGTHAENMHDMFAKDRQGSRHPGTGRANARLTEEDVRSIRSVPYFYGRTRHLARLYGVSDQTIREVLTNQAWKHVA